MGPAGLYRQGEDGCRPTSLSAGGAMSFELTKKIRTVLACLILEAGVLMGVPVRAEQVEELSRSLSQPKIAQTEPEPAEPAEE
jgi:hypothetical protein